MASIKILTYNVLKESTLNPGLVVGDIIDVYVDDTAIIVPAYIEQTGISAYLNGILMGSGSAILDTAPDVVSINDYRITFCSGTYQLVFGTIIIFPYGQYGTVADYPSCIVNPPTCDLIVVGIPEVTGSTDATTADGEFTINATSSNSIEYKIGSTFTYGDGTGQSSPTFSGLLPGTYLVFIRDSVNCFTTVQVVIPVGNTYGVRLRHEYDDYNGNQTRIDVVKKNYTDEFIQVCGDGVSFRVSMRAEGEDDKFKSLVSLSAELSLLSETDNQFSEIYTNDPNLYRIYYYKNFGSGFELQNTFKVLPQLYQSAYKAPPYFVSIQAIDGLAELKDNFLVQTNGQIYYGTTKLIKLVAYCLSVMKLDLDILVACNLYAVESSNILDPSIAMDNGDSDDPLDQAYIDYEAFYLAKAEPDLDFVLKSILDAFGCRIIQSDNRWNIIRIEEMVGDIDYRLFDSNGDYLSNGTINVVSEIQFPRSSTDMHFVGGDQSFSIKPGFGKIRAIYNMGLRPNVLKNGDFRLKLFPTSNPGGTVSYIPQIDFTGWLLVNAGYALSESYEQISETDVAYKITGDASMIPNFNGGNAYIQSDSYSITMGSNDSFVVSISVKVISTWQSNFLIGNPSKINVPYVRIRLSVKCGSNYLNADGTWSGSENIISFFTTDFDKYVDFDVTGNKPPTDDLLSVRVYHAYIYYAGYSDIATVEAISTYDGSQQTTPTGFKLEIREDLTYDSLHYYELQENTDAASGYDIIRPTDYNAGTNPRQWVKVARITIDDHLPPYSFGFCINKVQLQFLTGGKAPFDKVVRTKNGEASNKLLFDKDFYIGSYQTIITTESSFGLIGATLGNIYGGGASITFTTTSQLNAAIVYAGWLRDSTGVGYKFWKRDGITEEEFLHGITLKSYAGQYKRSWKVLNGGYYSKGNFKFINVLQEVNDNDTLYLPMSLTLDDKMCMLRGDAHELSNIYASPGSDGSGEAPYSSGFTTGFGASGFN